mgnify:CR=1 FL=1
MEFETKKMMNIRTSMEYKQVSRSMNHVVAVAAAENLVISKEKLVKLNRIIKMMMYK